MSRLLDENKRLRGAYERPERKWICGYTADGCPCHEGPDRRGRCRNSCGCNPKWVVKPGLETGGYVCTRSAAAGGTCAKGPLPDGSCGCSRPPCTPYLSVRAMRGRTIAWTFAFTVSLVVALLFSEMRWVFVNPGPLTHAHRTALAGLEGATAEGGVPTTGCVQCHAAAHTGPGGWLSLATGPGPVESAKCLNCHAMGDHPMLPHSAPPDWGEQVRLAKSGSPDPASPLAVRTVACAACHREHHGPNQDLTALSQQQCQVCHASSFVRFAHGHPDFRASAAGSGFPYRERPGILFDHAEHFARFAQERQAGNPAPVRCTDCHDLNPESGSMTTQSFEVSCTQCHTHVEQIAGTVHDPAIPVLELPGIDLKTLASQNHPLADWWPSGRRGEDLNPFMSLLVSGASVYPDPDMPAESGMSFASDQSLLDSLSRGMRDLREATPEQIAAVDRIARSIRFLLKELSGGDVNTVVRLRLEKALNRPLSQTEVFSLTSGLPDNLVQSAYTTWFASGARDGS